MQFFVGRPNFGHRQMLFACNGGRPHEVPHAVIHTPHAGLFVRDARTPDAYFACDRCGFAIRLRIEDGYDPTAAEVRAALGGDRTEEVVSSAARHHDDEEARDRRALATYATGAGGDKALETSRLLDVIESTPMDEESDDGQTLASA